MNFITNLVAAALPSASVETLVALLTTFTAKLAAAEAKQTALADSLDKESVRLAADAGVARESAARAARIAANINSLTA